MKLHIPSAALAAAVSLTLSALAASPAGATVTLEDYSFSTAAKLFFFPDNFAGAFTLQHDDVADSYVLKSINFSMYGMAFDTANTSASGSSSGVSVSGSTHDPSGSDAAFTLNFDPSPLAFTSFEASADFVNGETGIGGNGSTLVGSIGRTAEGVPEPATWALMLVGFGALGGVLRRRALAAA